MTVILAFVLVVHGLIHLLGFARAFGLADLPQLTQPISPLFGTLWLIATFLFLAAAGSMFAWPRRIARSAPMSACCKRRNCPKRRRSLSARMRDFPGTLLFVRGRARQDPPSGLLFPPIGGRLFGRVRV